MMTKLFVVGPLLVVLAGCGSSSTEPTTAQQIIEFKGHPPTAEQLAKVKSLGPGAMTAPIKGGPTPSGR